MVCSFYLSVYNLSNFFHILMPRNFQLQTPSVYRVVAMYDYSAQNIDELSFQRGDSITVDDKTDPDWWKGTIGSSTGLFPSNYVQDAPGNKCEWIVSNFIINFVYSRIKTPFQIKLTLTALNIVIQLINMIP